jgi:hypothetical protein
MEFLMQPLIRSKGGVWHVVEARVHESPRQAFGIAWKQVAGQTPEDAYRAWFAEQRAISKVLYLNKKENGS